MKALAARLELAGVPFRRDVPLAPLTWLGVGGIAPVLAEPGTAEQVVEVHRACRDLGVRLERLGSGANLLVAEGVLPLTVLKPNLKGMEGPEAGAGANLEAFIRKTIEAGLSGLEGLVGIPASVGGAVAMNAGGKHGEVKDALEAVVVADADGIRTLSREACGFAYRKASLGGATVVSASFALFPGDPAVLREKARAVREEKRRTQPLLDSSAGCIFRNPPGGSAGRLIDLAGLKGMREGAAQVSEVHANFIVNLGGAKADDIRCLIDRVRDGVRRAHGVALELEVVQWP